MAEIKHGARRGAACHSTAPSSASGKNNPLIELLIAIVIPSLILMKLSGPEDLGAVNALLLALAFPLAWGARDLLTRRKLNLFAVLGCTVFEGEQMFVSGKREKTPENFQKEPVSGHFSAQFWGFSGGG